MQESPRATVVIWVIAAALAVLAGMRLLGGGDSRPPPVSVDGRGAAAGGTVAAGPGGDPDAAGASAAGPRDPAAGSPGTASDVYVHVAGAVRRPGLIRLPAASRVATALERAGGPRRRADLTLVNLAARVQDGQQIVVPVRGRPTGTGAAATATGEPPEAKIHLSTATAEQLDEIDGIGPTLAERIVEYRDAHGGFRSLEELAEVEGIGEQRLATLRDALQP